MSQTTTTSAGVHWDLAPLFADADAARAAVPELIEACAAFRERYRGRVGELEAAELASASKSSRRSTIASRVWRPTAGCA